MFSTVSPALDNKVPSDLTQSMEPMTEIIEGLHASASECARLKKLVGSDFVNFSLCVNPQLFKLVELSM